MAFCQMSVERGPVYVNYPFNFQNTTVASDVVGFFFSLNICIKIKSHHLFLSFPQIGVTFLWNRGWAPAGCSPSVKSREHRVGAAGLGDAGTLMDENQHLPEKVPARAVFNVLLTASWL